MFSDSEDSPSDYERNSERSDSDSDDRLDLTNNFVPSSTSEEAQHPKRWRIPRKPKTSRKRPRDEKNWSVNVEKRARHAGEINMSKKGKINSAPKIKFACKCQRFHCFYRITEDRRRVLFQQFWQTEEQKDKWAYIARFYSTSRAVEGTVGSRKKQSRNYFLDVGEGKTVKVCKQMFLNTFGISEHVFKTIEQKKKKNNGFVTSDKRGKHNNKANKTPVAIFNSVEEHIKSYVAQPSYYCRKDTTKEYLLHHTLDVAKLHREYLEELKNKRSPVPLA